MLMTIASLSMTAHTLRIKKNSRRNLSIGLLLPAVGIVTDPPNTGLALQKRKPVSIKCNCMYEKTYTFWCVAACGPE